MGRKGKSKATRAKEQKERMREKRQTSATVDATMGLAPRVEEKPLARTMASPSSASEKNCPNALSFASSQGSLSISHVDMAPTSDSPPWVCAPPRVPSPIIENQGVAGQAQLVEVTSIIKRKPKKMCTNKLTKNLTDNHTNNVMNTETILETEALTKTDIETKLKHEVNNETNSEISEDTRTCRNTKDKLTFNNGADMNIANVNEAESFNFKKQTSILYATQQKDYKSLNLIDINETKDRLGLFECKNSDVFQFDAIPTSTDKKIGTECKEYGHSFEEGKALDSSSEVLQNCKYILGLFCNFWRNRFNCKQKIHVFFLGGFATLEIHLASVLVLLISVATGCDDLNTQLCIEIGKKFPGICGDSCLSQLCQRSCGLCPVQCYECHEVDDPKNCSTVIECPTRDHYCFTTQSFADNFKKIYKLGCSTKTLCKAYFGDRIGRGLRVEATCCVDDKCNNMTPEEIENEKANHHPILSLNNTHSGTLPDLISDCNNIDEGICGHFATVDPEFCHTHYCAATKLCPRMCKQCFRCYSCSDISKTEACSTTSSCSNIKKCFSMETLSLDFRPVYRLGCMDTALCERFKAAPLSIFGKRQDLQLKGGCCSSDLCNHDIHQFSITTTTQTTTTGVCGHHSKNVCPSGFSQYLSSCYMKGPSQVTQVEAESYCHSRCSHLANFDSLAQLKGTVAHMVIPSHDKLWTDAVSTLHGFAAIETRWSTTGSLIATELSHELSSTNSPSKHCAVIQTGLRNQVNFVAEICNNHAEPLCETELV